MPFFTPSPPVLQRLRRCTAKPAPSAPQRLRRCTAKKQNAKPRPETKVSRYHSAYHLKKVITQRLSIRRCPARPLLATERAAGALCVLSPAGRSLKSALPKPLSPSLLPCFNAFVYYIRTPPDCQRIVRLYRAAAADRGLIPPIFPPTPPSP